MFTTFAVFVFMGPEGTGSSTDVVRRPESLSLIARRAGVPLHRLREGPTSRLPRNFGTDSDGVTPPHPGPRPGGDVLQVSKWLYFLGVEVG